MNILIISTKQKQNNELNSNLFHSEQEQFAKHNYPELSHVELFSVNCSSGNKLIVMLNILLAYVRFIPLLMKPFHVIHIYNLGLVAPLGLLYRMFNSTTKVILSVQEEEVSIKSFSKFFKYLVNNMNGIIASHDAASEALWLTYNVKSEATVPKGINRHSFYPISHIEKNYDLLMHSCYLTTEIVEALKVTFLDFHKQVNLCFIGPEIKSEELDDLKILANITFTGFLSSHEHRTVYNQARFFIYPSLADDADLLVSQAMYCGTPAIVNRNGGGQFQVVHGINGFEFDCNETWDFSQIIKEALSYSVNEYNELSLASRTSNSKLSLDSTFHKLLEVYDQVEHHYRCSFHHLSKEALKLSDDI